MNVGGYFNAELPIQNSYLNNGLFLNSGRNAFSFILDNIECTKLFVPYYTCDAIIAVLARNKQHYEFYNLDQKLLPILDDNIDENEFLLYNNYFGVCNQKVNFVCKKYSNVIVDNAQSFFSFPNQGESTLSFYSPRKFIGLPDGGIAFLTHKPNSFEALKRDTSYKNAIHLFKSIDLGIEAAYPDFQKSEEIVGEKRIKRVSMLTERMYKSIDLIDVKNKREHNFRYIDERIGEYNMFQKHFSDQIEAPMVYPFLLNNGEELRKELLKEKVFTASYWKNVLEWLKDKPNSLEVHLTKNLVALPIDQRIDLDILDRLCNIIHIFIKENNK
jgi:hypothetical protein